MNTMRRFFANAPYLRTFYRDPVAGFAIEWAESDGAYAGPFDALCWTLLGHSANTKQLLESCMSRGARAGLRYLGAPMQFMDSGPLRLGEECENGI